jgi:8-oxo-dGTP pyrophosphatase MutT (NUDIX family)
MPTVECNSIKGGKISVPKEKLVFRPSVYGVIIHGNKILMIRNKSNGKLFFPGGGVKLGETLPDALRREVIEETGINVEVGKFLHFTEQFFYWDPGDEAYHMFSFFYNCRPKTFTLLDDDKVDDVEAEKPRWIEIDKVKHAKGNVTVVKEILRLL